MNGKQLIKLAKQQGFEEARVTGSHHIMKKGGKIVAIPIHSSKDIPVGTTKKILKGLGLE